MRQAIVFGIGIAAAVVVAALVLTASQAEPVYVAITVDTETDLPPYQNTSAGMTEGVPLLLDLFAQYNISVTWFVVAEAAERYPDVIRNISAAGHEIGCHGLGHENFTALNSTEKLRRVRDATAILTSITGKRPTAWRSPYQSSDTELLSALTAEDYHVEASGAGYPRWSGGLLIAAVSQPYFYPSAIWPAAWPDVYERALAAQAGKRKIIIVGLHSWEVLPMTGGPEEYRRAAGNYTLAGLGELLAYLKDKNVRYITMEELYAVMG